MVCVVYVYFNVDIRTYLSKSNPLFITFLANMLISLFEHILLSNSNFCPYFRKGFQIFLILCEKLQLLKIIKELETLILFHLSKVLKSEGQNQAY